MNLSDLNNLDMKDIAASPAPVRVLILVLLFAAVLAGGWFLVWSDALNNLESAQREEQSLRDTYTVKKGQAVHYEAYKRRLGEIEQSLAALLRQLPDRSQMDALLTDINQVGVGRGLEFELFRPGAETLADFYATLPVAIKVSGGYHDIGWFTNDLAKLPRIVTLHDVVLTPGKDANLSMEARIQTYRYLDEKELAEVKKQKMGAAKP
ncbi:MAG: type IV pilus assembly protein PilO [bacterium]|jgi:type IV pilus assembly protein PilO|nr:MAG: type IV pilus assembly protein PilO [bacterium]KAF0150156.1 MAG: type IV pilus assembly protein PilO [bacterium]KAF0169636.1 MAG: type IV pilus assembly protein PilO [bacterium]TXT22972.1 MAG: type IV pilus assembly protein PilO [bacterium]